MGRMAGAGMLSIGLGRGWMPPQTVTPGQNFTEPVWVENAGSTPLDVTAQITDNTPIAVVGPSPASYPDLEPCSGWQTSELTVSVPSGLAPGKYSILFEWEGGTRGGDVGAGVAATRTRS
jgi:hypothetical protein